MNQIKIKFLGLGYNEFYQANVEIYDDNACLVYEGLTYNSIIEICLKKNKIYRLKAISSNEKINVYFYVSSVDTYIFAFNRSKLNMIKDRIITFLLTDYHYDNLPIGKGELYLWQR